MYGAEEAESPRWREGLARGKEILHALRNLIGAEALRLRELSSKIEGLRRMHEHHYVD